MSKKTKNESASVLIALLQSLQKRLGGISKETHENTEAIAALRSAIAGVDEKTSRLGLVDISQGKRIDEIKGYVDMRENQQALRDQNNVQALTNLRDSTQKAFNQVKDDIAELLKRVQSLNERVGKVESQNVILATRDSVTINRVDTIWQKFQGVNGLPTDHVWVNKKLTGVYDSITELEERLELLETSAVPSVNFYGYTASVQGPRLILEDVNKESVVFPFPHKIANLVHESYGLIITLENGDKYILCGGPTPVTMFVNVFSKAS